jgi:hypothetical protein
MKLRIVAVVTATVIAFGSPAEAKGPSALTITGVGVDRPIVLEDDSLVWPSIVNESVFFDAAFSSTEIFGGLAFAKARSTSAHVDLGPRLRLTWSVYWDTNRPHHLVQDLYPDAPGGPLLYTPAGQTLYDQKTLGGWYRARAVFVAALETAGVPSAAELRTARTAFSSYVRPTASGPVARW